MAKMNDKMQEDIIAVWEAKRMQAQAGKRSYRETARLASRYYDGPHDFVFEGLKGGPPTFKITVNKVYEMVSLFGPMTYAKNPTRAVTPRPPGDPVFSKAVETYLNYTPNEFDLKGHSKRAIDESLLNGRGVLFTGIDARSGLARSVSRNTKDILVDPRQDTWYDGDYMMWLQRDIPIWKIAKQYGKKVAERMCERGAKASTVNSSYDWGGPLDEDTEQTEEMAYLRFNSELEKGTAKHVSLIHVYSKMGVGLREHEQDKKYMYGDHPQDKEDNLLIIYEAQSKTVLYVGPWDIPFWADPCKKASWPFSFLDPAENFDKPWPISLIKPSLGLQMFLDWGWSFAMGFVQASSRSIMVTGKQVDDQLELALHSNGAITVVPMEIPPGMDARTIIQAIENPKMGPELLGILKEAEILFEKNTGMNEIMYGTTSKSMRSATEADMKAQFSKMRVDNIIDKAEDWQTAVARHEALAAIWKLGGEDMLPIMGEELAVYWDQYRGAQLTDIKQAAMEYTYEIHTGTMRKRTPQARIDTAVMAYDRFAPIRLQVGDLPGYNMLEQEVLKAYAVPNTERFMLGTPPPQPGDSPDGKGGGEAPAPQAPEVMKIEGGQPVFGQPVGEGT